MDVHANFVMHIIPRTGMRYRECSRQHENRTMKGKFLNLTMATHRQMYNRIHPVG